jgi:hypothetical protein
MGIPSLNSAIFYIVSLYFHCHLEQASHCHFERAKRVEKSKSCKYPEPSAKKTVVFLAAIHNPKSLWNLLLEAELHSKIKKALITQASFKEAT